jgi:tRNA-dependent cyclodipeptide synthase
MDTLTGIIERIVTKRDLSSIDRRGPVRLILPMSCGNPYFSKKRISNLICVLDEKFSDCIIRILPLDGPARHNYRALGMKDEDIAAYQRKKGNQIRNSVKAAIKAEFQPLIEIQDSSIEAQGDGFMANLHRLILLFGQNGQFRESIKLATCDYLNSIRHQPKWSNYQAVADSVDVATEYHIEELALFLTLPPDRENIVIYHRPWPILKGLIDGSFGITPDNYLSFLQLEVSEDDPLHNEQILDAEGVRSEEEVLSSEVGG